MAIEDILKRIANGEWSQPGDQAQSLPAKCFDQTGSPSKTHEAAATAMPNSARYSDFEYEARAEDPYWQAVNEAQRRLGRLNWPPNLRVWLDVCHRDVYRRLYVELPSRIERLWDRHSPIPEFERALDEWVNAHQEACSLWKAECTKESSNEIGREPKQKET
jgi:hypothetical protein